MCDHLQHVHRYQCAFSTFAQAGYTSEDAQRIMREAVKLAAEARRRFEREEAEDVDAGRAGHPRSPRSIKVALSLGPFGATLSPAQEFDGFYPPPFGPKAHTSAESNINAFPNDEYGRTARQSAIESLTAFHLERLAVFTEDPDVWETIDWIAFETVPLTTEIIAIRSAMGRLAEKRKPWWISTVWPNGQFPEQAVRSERVSARIVTRALYGMVDEQRQLLPRPTGIGINVNDISADIQMMTRVIEEEARSESHDPADEAGPFLVAYPNRGDIFDVVRRTWASATLEGLMDEEWARGLCEVVHPFLEENTRSWRGLIVGGCCKTGPAEIAALKKLLNQIHG